MSLFKLEIVDLKQPHKHIVNAAAVAKAERLYSATKSGEITGFVVCAVDRNNDCVGGYAGEISWSSKTLRAGLLTLCLSLRRYRLH